MDQQNIILDEQVVPTTSASDIAHQESHSPLHAVKHLHSNSSDPSLLMKKSNEEFNTKKCLPPIQVTSNKTDAQHKSKLETSFSESEQNDISSDEETAAKLDSKPILIDESRAVSGSMREVVRVQIAEDIEKELISIDCQTDMTWIESDNRKSAARTKKLKQEPRVENIEKPTSSVITTKPTIDHQKLTIASPQKAQSSMSVQGDKAISYNSLFNKSEPLIKETSFSQKKRNSEKNDTFESSSEDELESNLTEDIEEDVLHETLPSVGPPTILQYHRESEENPLQLTASVHMSESNEDYTASSGMFEGICEFCHQEVKTFPTIEDQKRLPPEELFCCEQYRDFISFVIEASKGNGEGVLPNETKDSPTSPTTAADALTARSARFAKDGAAKRMLERQLSRNKAMGLKTSHRPSLFSSRMLNTDLTRDSTRSSFQGNPLRLSNAASNLAFDQAGGPQFMRQIKTISYQLSSMKCLEEGWTLRPPSPLFDDQSATDYSDIFELDVNGGPWAEHSDVVSSNKTVIVKYYDDGNLFLVRFLDGTGTIYYPSKRPAINICQGSFARGLLFIIHADSDDSPVCGYFDTRGYATTYYPNNQIRVCLKPLGGVEVGAGGEKKRKWRWTDQAEHVHAPPLQPLTVAISSHIAIRIMARDNITLTFMCCKKSCRLNVGARLKMVSSEVTLPQEPTDRCSQLRKDIKLRIKELFSKISYLLSHPRAPVTLPPLPVVPGSYLSYQPEDARSPSVRDSTDLHINDKKKNSTTTKNKRDLPPITVTN